MTEFQCGPNLCLFLHVVDGVVLLADHMHRHSDVSVSCVLFLVDAINSDWLVRQNPHGFVIRGHVRHSGTTTTESGFFSGMYQLLTSDEE